MCLCPTKRTLVMYRFNKAVSAGIRGTVCLYAYFKVYCYRYEEQMSTLGPLCSPEDNPGMTKTC